MLLMLEDDSDRIARFTATFRATKLARPLHIWRDAGPRVCQRHSLSLFSLVGEPPRSGQAMQNIQDSIEQLYGAFAKNPQPQHIEGCPCCIDRKGIQVLLSKNLRAITPDELSSYASSAFLTVGDVDDYLYFLPRILEITATEFSWWPDPEVTGRAIQSTNPDSWTDAQRSAVNQFLEAVIGSLIESEDYWSLNSWMYAIARMGFDVTPYLTQIAQSPAAVLAYFEDNVESLRQNKLSNSFWELPCPGHDAIVNWFFSPEITKIPFDAYGCVLKREPDDGIALGNED